MDAVAPTPIASARVRRLYGDVAALLAGTLVQPAPTLGRRSDGAFLFYEGAVNGVFGRPESAKTLAVSAVAAEVLVGGGRVLFVDVDHNGIPATVHRFRRFGVDDSVLADLQRFRYAAPDDAASIAETVQDAVGWEPRLAVFDSVSQLLALHGANSDSTDDYTMLHRRVFMPLARAGAAVVLVDHEGKVRGSAGQGPAGTDAKKRVVDGALYRVTASAPFVPGRGGRAHLSIVKDRHGAVRRASGGGVEPVAAVFEVVASGDDDVFGFGTVDVEAPSPVVARWERDYQRLLALDPPPASANDAIRRLGIKRQHGQMHFRRYLSEGVGGGGSGSPPKGGGTGNHPNPCSSGTRAEPSGTGEPVGGEE